jgi:DNA-binding NarL/FixJ family response regulator
MKKTSTDKTRIFIVDDHPLLRKGLGELINKEPDMVVVGEADDAPTGIKGITTIRPDLVIVDISLKSMNGLELIKNIKVLDPSIQVLVLSMHDETVYALRVLKAGAKAYVMKQEMVEKVMEAIRRIRAGKVFVSDRVATQMKGIESGAGGITRSRRCTWPRSPRCSCTCCSSRARRRASSLACRGSCTGTTSTARRRSTSRSAR